MDGWIFDFRYWVQVATALTSVVVEEEIGGCS